MANNVITSSMITDETMRILHNESAFLGNINTEYKKEFAQEGAKAGATVNVRRPVQFTVRSGAAINIQDVNETTVPVTISPEFGVDFQFSDYDLTLTIDKFSERYLKPAGTRLAAELDKRIGALYTSIANFAGTPGTVPSTVQVPLDAAAILDNFACPRDGRRTLAINPITNSKLVGGMSGLFNNQSIQGDQIKRGMMDTNLGMKFQMSQNVPTHTVGPLGGTPLINGANQGLINAGATDNPYGSTTSLVTDGWTAAAASRLKAGDVITIAGVFDVNLETKQVLSSLKQFVVTADVSSDASGNLTAVISPAIIAGGAYQNCSARPADNAAITVVTGTANTSYAQNLMFHKDALTLVTCSMDLPKGMDMASQSEYDGVGVRFVRGFDITNNRRVCRFDILAGFAAIRPEWALRLTA
jgi:hypothetical protein